jgi:hypothetical protein
MGLERWVRGVAIVVGQTPPFSLSRPTTRKERARVIVELRLRTMTTGGPTKDRASARTAVQARRAWNISGAAGPDKYEVSGQVIPSCQSRGSSRLDFQHSQVSLIIEIRGDDFLNNTPKFSLVLFKLPR